MPALNYDPSIENWRFITRWRYTVLPMVFADPLLWVLLIIHALMLYEESRSQSITVVWPTLDWKAALVPTSLLTFFVVFYGGNCYSRFYMLHGHCMGISGCVAEWAFLIREHFGDMPPNVRWNSMRLMLAAMQVHYAFLGGDSSQGSMGEEIKAITKAEWRAIRKHNFLTRAEIEELEAFRGAKFFLPLVWSLAEVKTALQAQVLSNDATTPSLEKMLLTMPGVANVQQRFEATALRFRSHCSQTLALLRMPVPFAYFHILRLLLLISLFGLGYALVQLEWGHYMVSMIIYMIICTVNIGMQAIAVSMSDPFGDDDTDFDLERFISDAYDNAVAILCEQRVPLYDELPKEMGSNPLADDLKAISTRTWTGLIDGGSGLEDHNDTPRRQSLRRLSMRSDSPIVIPGITQEQPASRAALPNATKLPEKKLPTPRNQSYYRPYAELPADEESLGV